MQKQEVCMVSSIALLLTLKKHNAVFLFYPPASEASREVANLTERKNPHTHVYGVIILSKNQ